MSEMKDRLVFHIGHSAGFYSEFNNMVLAIVYCERHGIDFELYSEDANFKVDKGWNDYFEPFCPERKSVLHHYINKRFEAPKGGRRKALYDIYKTICPHAYLTCDLWNQFRHIDKLEISTEETALLSQEVIKRIYHFNPRTQLKINQLSSALSIQGPYVGFHLRGGDKVAEHALMDIETYISKAESISNIRQGFIYTDDYRYYEAAQKNFPEWTFFTLAKPSDMGYFHNDFLKLDKYQKSEKLINMFASMELLSNADYAICTYSSNPGMFLGMRMGDRAIGVDFEKWIIW